ncbi:YheV family putative zinc ribbon protein [Pleionea sp. CnH1-48]|uniref:YheV family putative zinc ribbon protein n=1 Tax=Pleionea sp. CnH1-48 TaxID=2954494 RepID=UPI002097AF86|nr:YheV family putative zinc ribbon protein [Pleionea sp. CnH1-48]MCO7227081.1 YheV family putative metal-binding protein [Pleionea sp. CnH1-48]
MNNRRFIAGAVCPECQAQDRIVTYQKNEQDFFECIDCGYIEGMNEKSQKSDTPDNKHAAAENMIQWVSPDE